MANIAISFNTSNDRDVDILVNAYTQRGQLFYQMTGVEIDGNYTSAADMSSPSFFRVQRWAEKHDLEYMICESLNN